jgi:endonuclease III
VLVRLGFAPEKKSYSATYKGVQQALAPQLPNDCAELVRAHQLLRQHGQELCKRSKPLCARCPLRAQCAFFAEAAFAV